MQSLKADEPSGTNWQSEIFSEGKSKRSGLRKWLRALPPESIHRLAIINSSSNGARHIVICLAFGIYDRNIRKINSMITSLLLTRMRAERSGNTILVERINTFMDEMHVAIDSITGVSLPRRKDGPPCNR